MTPYKDRHLRNEYQLGSVATEVAEPPSTEPEPPADDEDEDEDEDDDPAGEFVCPDCGRGFATEHGLKIHTGKAHAEET